MKEERLTSKDFWERFYIRQKIEVVSDNGKYLFERHLRKIFHKHLSKGNQLLIEFGCGNSDWLPYFAKYFGFNISGVDFSESGIALIRKKLDINGVSGNIYLLDFFNLPEGFSNRFDIAVSFGVIEHFEHPHEILKVFSKTLRVNGMIITVIPKLTGFQGFLQKRIVNREIYEKHKVLSIDQLKYEHIKAGFYIKFAGEVGLLSVGLNFGQKKFFFDYLYRIYLKMVNFCFRDIFSLRFVNTFKVGSSFIVIAEKSES